MRLDSVANRKLLIPESAYENCLRGAQVMIDAMTDRIDAATARGKFPGMFM